MAKSNAELVRKAAVMVELDLIVFIRLALYATGHGTQPEEAYKALEFDILENNKCYEPIANFALDLLAERIWLTFEKRGNRTLIVVHRKKGGGHEQA